MANMLNITLIRKVTSLNAYKFLMTSDEEEQWQRYIYVPFTIPSSDPQCNVSDCIIENSPNLSLAVLLLLTNP